MQKNHTIIIVGGGFAGLRCALSLSKKKLPIGTRIKLISDREHFEYHGALYRIVTGHSPLEVCLPLREVLADTDVELCIDRIVDIDTHTKVLTSKSGFTYNYNTLVIGLGAQTIYYDVPGLQETAHGIKTINDALKLKRHLHETFQKCSTKDDVQRSCGSNIVVVGGGATGVEIASELAVYTRKLAINHGLDPKMVSVNLIESCDRILPTLPESFSKKIAQKMRALGVHISTHRNVTHCDDMGVCMKDKELKTKTVIWTAGVRGHQLIESSGLQVDKGGRAIVCAHLRAKNHPEIYVAGDGAATPLSGMAQTALQDGHYIAGVIARTLDDKPPKKYRQLQSICAIPVGPGWAGALFYGLRCYGVFGWIVRRTVDMVVFLAFLSPYKALKTFRTHKISSESCPTCKRKEN